MMEENLVVIGWCMGAGDVQFTLLDEQGNILPAEVSRYYRKDLKAVFPEQDAERKPGFQVKADLHDRRDVRKVRLVMEDEDRHRTVCVLKEFRSENKVLKYASKAGNAVRYLERNGMSATIRKVQTKLGKKKRPVMNSGVRIMSQSRKRLSSREEQNFVIIRCFRLSFRYIKQMSSF